MDKKTAIITGGSRGIGRAISVELAKSGMNIVINYASNEYAAKKTMEECLREAELSGHEGIKIITVKGDISDSSDCEVICNVAIDEFGRIDVLVNNAGITRDSLAMRMSDEDFDAVIKTNLYGPFFMMRQVAKPMMKQKFGRIVNISSVTGLIGNAGQINYAAAKAGLIGMTKSLAREMATRGITVNAVAPGFIDTDMTAALSEDVENSMEDMIPVKRIGSPRDIASAVRFLVSDGAGYITGEVLRIDGGVAI
ncbi:MAG: 3-oxoacyl-[acyl-carrier-protein] reductase [Clostridiales bacterium]|nr:3-oxoacyl-[acyl-carrier-protein] reductase [Clostridiales bacterium]